MPVVPFVPLIAAGVGAAGSAITAGKGTTTKPLYTPQQTGIQNQLASTIQSRLADPTAGMAPLKTAAIGNINKTYSGLEGRLQSSASSRGFGRSGKVLTNQKQLELSRAGDMGTLESNFAGLQLNQENNVIDQAMRFGFGNPGSNTAGSPLGAGISSGAQGLMALFTIAKMTGQGGWLPGMG